MPWIVVMTKPNHEAIAASNLQRQLFNYYYPRFLLKKPNKKPQIKPLFPRYVFVHIEQLWRSLAGTRGVSCLLMGAEGPRTVNDQIIADLQSREDKFGYYQLLLPELNSFKIGQKVKAETGPLAGHLLIYQGMLPKDRVACLFEAMGRQSRV